MAKHKWLVQMQHGVSGEIVEKEFIVGWDPEKVPSDEIAKACAAQETVAGGKINDGYKHPYAGLTAIYQEKIG